MKKPMSSMRERMNEEPPRPRADDADPGGQLSSLQDAAQRVVAAGRAAVQQALSADSEGFLRATAQASGE